MHPSSSGLGHRPFTAVTGVRIPVGVPRDMVTKVIARSCISWLEQRRVIWAGPSTVLKTDGLRERLEFDSTIPPPIRSVSSNLTASAKHGVLAELVEGTFLLRRHTVKKLCHWFESNTLRHLNAASLSRITSAKFYCSAEKGRPRINIYGGLRHAKRCKRYRYRISDI